MKLGIRGHDICGRGSIDDLISGLKPTGIDNLQLVSYKSFSSIDYKEGEITPEKAENIGNKLNESGISVALIGAYFNPVHSNKEKVNEGIAVFKDYLAAAASMGCKTVGSETGSFNDDSWTYNPQNRTEEARVTVRDTFLSLCDFGRAHNSNVGIEGAAGHVMYDVATLAKTVSEINRDNLSVIFDLYNFLDESNSHSYLSILDEGLESFKGKICCFHIKDCVLKNGAPVQCPVGNGDFDFKEILTKIRNYYDDPVLILEGTTGDDILSSAQFLKNMWSSL